MHHDRYDIEQAGRGRTTAVCACGWRSATALSSGVAVSRWDDHARHAQRVAVPQP